MKSTSTYDNSSSSTSSPSMSPVPTRKNQRKTKKQRQESKMEILRKMIGCDEPVPDFELLQKVMEYINRLRDVLDENNQNDAENSTDLTSVSALLHRMSLSPLKDANSPSASRA